MRRILLVMLLAMVWEAALVADADAAEYVWWEGEDAVETNFPDRTWFTPRNDTEADVLSEGAWLTNDEEREGPEAFARYTVTVAEAAQYDLWVRKFYKHGPFRWRFDDAEWVMCGRDIALADTVVLRTHVCANWVFLGSVELTAGEHEFEMRLLAAEGEKLTCGFDAFCLSPGAFTPNGKHKPGLATGLAEEGWFAFEPGADSFGDEALLDLRSLNEDEAGQSGFVRRDGDRFTLGDGAPVRFWAVNVSGNNAGQNRRTVDYLARRLAKLGVNMVRYHGPFFDEADPARVNPKTLDDLHYLVAAMKREGIYTSLSFYFPLWFGVKPHYGIEGYDGEGNKLPFTLLYHDERMQEIHRSWTTALMTSENPYTGMTLAEDPALSIVEIINEDSFFFWTFKRGNVPELQWERLERMYAAWLIGRHGSLDAALALFGDAGMGQDDAADGRIGLYDIWHLTTAGLEQGGDDKRARASEQVRFLTELQRGFYQDTASFLRDGLGYGGLISCSNWKTADARLLDALERYSYTAGDVIDRHGYFGGRAKGDGAGYSVRVGHSYTDSPAVLSPESLPLQFAQVADYPQTISEIGWPNPNRYRGDCTFLTAATSALQGVDGIYFFAVSSNSLVDAGLSKFAVSCPAVAGTFPASALLYRMGYLAEGEMAAREELSLEDLYALEGSAALDAAALDALRAADVPEGDTVAGAVAGIDPLTFYVGRVTRRISTEPGESEQRDLSAHIDREVSKLRSLSGELAWDWGAGLVTVDTPCAQGVAGFLAQAGAIRLGDVTIECANDYGAILIVSLDGEPLATSRRILIQAMTEEKPYGFAVEGGRVTALGGTPFNVRRIAASVSLRLAGDGAGRVIALDGNGYATDAEVTVAGAGGEPLTVTLAEDAIYHIVERQ